MDDARLSEGNRSRVGSDTELARKVARPLALAQVLGSSWRKRTATSAATGSASLGAWGVAWARSRVAIAFTSLAASRSHGLGGAESLRSAARAGRLVTRPGARNHRRRQS